MGSRRVAEDGMAHQIPGPQLQPRRCARVQLQNGACRHGRGDDRPAQRLGIGRDEYDPRILADEDHVEWNIRVLHPHGAQIGPAIVEQHAGILREAAPEHQADFLFAGRQREFDGETLRPGRGFDDERRDRQALTLNRRPSPEHGRTGGQQHEAQTESTQHDGKVRFATGNSSNYQCPHPGGAASAAERFEKPSDPKNLIRLIPAEGRALHTASLSAQALSVRYDGAPVLRGLDLELPAGQTLALLGPSGAGKSTLLRLAAGLEQAESGTLTRVAGRIGYMTQDDALLPWASALSNVMLGAKLRGEAPDQDRAQALLQASGLAAQAHKRPGALSGGMRKRVALARLLYEDPALALLDEPFAALDAITRASIQKLAAQMLAGRTVLLVTHDPLEAIMFGSMIAVLHPPPHGLRVLPLPPPAPPGELRDPFAPELQDLRRAILSALEPGP